VERFIEKPSGEKAEQLIKDCLWNSGIFIFSPSLLAREFELHSPEIASHMQSYEELLNSYNKLASISIDYAIMEKSSRSAVVPYSGEWQDIGSWESVHALMQKDEGNAVKGEAMLYDTSSSLIYGDERIVACIGVEDVVIVDTRDALLVASLIYTLR